MDKQKRSARRQFGVVGKRRPHETGGPHDYGGNPDLIDEANEPGDRVQGSDGRPVTGKP